MRKRIAGEYIDYASQVSCTACEDRGWCADCEGAQRISSMPRDVPCPCGNGKCRACGGASVEIPPSSAGLTDRWPWRPRRRRERHAAPPAWVEEIIRAPDDLYVRLVGADIVEREDPERARFIRLQVEAEQRLVAATTAIDIERILEETRCIDVTRNAPELATLLADRVIATPGFARGMVEHVTMAAVDFLAHADDVFSRAPIRFLTITHATDLGAIAASPALRRLRGLRVPRRESRPTLDPMRRERFELFDVNHVDDAALSALCESPHLGRLEFLDLDGHFGISVPTWGRLALAAPALRWVAGAPSRGEVMIEEAGYELTRWIEPSVTAIAIDAAAGSQVAWLPLDEPYLITWERMRAVCAHAPVMRRRAFS